MRSRLSGTRGRPPAQCNARSHAAVPLNLTADVRQINMKTIHILVCALMAVASAFASDSNVITKVKNGNSAAVALLLQQAKEVGLVIQDVDGSRDEYITFTVSGGPKVEIQWLEMGRNTDVERMDLRSRLTKLKAIMEHAKQNNINKVDLSDKIAEPGP